MNSDIELFLRENPLFKFSMYTHGQQTALKTVREMLRGMEPLVSEGRADRRTFNEYYPLFWLWVLGAYEVLRTMDQHKDCFVEAKHSEITALKRGVKMLRIPFAKQEIADSRKIADSRRSTQKFYAELSVIAVREGLVFGIGDNEYHSPEFMDNVLNFLSGFTLDDVISEMPVNRPKRET